MMDKQYRCSLSRLLFSYWKGEERKKAWIMGLLIATLTIAAVYMTLLLNDWFNSFYSALQNYDCQAIYHGLIQFTGYAFAYIAFSVYADYFQQKLALRWRRWMTEKYLARWTAGDMYYRMEVFSCGRGDNPDQRISEDIDSFTSQSLSLMQGLLQAVTTIVCFIVVLWNLSETLTFTLWGHTFHLEGYLVWTALLYSVAGTWVTHQVGKKLIALNYEQQKAAFVRILLRKPRWLFLDEASSAMDEETEAALCGLLTHLPSTVISIGHRSTLDKFHERGVEI